jgi:hypothetical protein
MRIGRRKARLHPDLRKWGIKLIEDAGQATAGRSPAQRNGRRGGVLAFALAVAASSLAAATALAQENAQGIDFDAVAGQEFETAVATFEEGVGDFSATIDWGDGTPGSVGTVSPLESCPNPDAVCYEVRGTHTYSDPGNHPVEVAIGPPDDPGAVRVRATATVVPPDPGAPTAQIALAKSQVRPGEAAIVDASGSSGEIERFAFDLNGNGTYETKSRFPHASVVHTVPGSKPIGVQVTGSDGATSTAVTTVNVAGGMVTPPPGQPPLGNGTVVGSIHASQIEAMAEAQLEAYLCPVTVQVGVAEATVLEVFPPQGKPCFERKLKPGSGPSLKHPNYPQFVAGEDEVLLNGIQISTRPNPNASNNNLVIYEAKKIVTQRYPNWQPVVLRLRKDSIGGIVSKQFNLGSWHVASPGTVGIFPIEDYFAPRLLGLPVVAKDTPIKFTANHRSELQVFVAPPFDLSLLGPANSPTGQTPLTLRADNTDGLQVEGSIIASKSYHLDLPLGIFHLTGTLHFSKEGSSNVWRGDVNLRIPDTPIDNINGTIKFKDGSFEYAEVEAPFKRPGLGPIGCCIYLVGLKGQLTSHSIQGSATFAAGPDLIGDFRAAEATANLSIQYSPFVLAFTAKPLRIAKWEVPANTGAVITKDKFFTYAFWDGSLAVLSWKVNVEVMIGNPWHIAGGGTACAGVWPLKGCANVHGAAGPKGVTACAGVDLGVTSIEGGIRVPWNPLNFDDYHAYTGCSFQLVKTKVGAAAAAAIRAAASAAGARAAAYPVRVPGGLRAALFVIEGRGSPPQISLRGPRGPKITTPPPDVETVRGRRWIAVRTNANSVHVMVARPAAGRWKVRELAGSPTVKSVRFAKALPGRFARGRVSGKGRRRTLHYRVARAPGTRVTFLERGGDRSLQDPERVVDRTIGRAKRSRGKIRFTPGEAKVRRRRIVAVIESQGAAIKTELVARFKAPRFRLPAAPRVTVRRRRGAMVVRWSKVPGAQSYQALINQSDAATHYLRRRAGRRGVRIRPFGGASSARVEVRAISPAGYIGKRGLGRLRALAPLRLARKQRIAKVLRAGAFPARCTSAGDGRCEITVSRGSRRLATGAGQLRYGQTKRVRVKLTPAGRKLLRKRRRRGQALTLRVSALVPGRAVRDRRIRLR